MPLIRDNPRRLLCIKGPPGVTLVTRVRVLECLPDLKLSDSRAYPNPRDRGWPTSYSHSPQSSPEPEGSVSQPQDFHSVTLGPHKKTELVVNSAPKELIKHTQDSFIILTINSQAFPWAFPFGLRLLSGG